MLAFGNDSEQRGCEDFKNIIDAQHLAARCPRRIKPGYQKMFCHPTALLGSHGLRIKHADDAIGMADGGDFRIRDDHRLSRKTQRKRGAALDPGRTVAENPVEPALELGEELADLLL